jgi:hypothetical protein
MSKSKPALPTNNFSVREALGYEAGNRIGGYSSGEGGFCLRLIAEPARCLLNPPLQPTYITHPPIR